MDKYRLKRENEYLKTCFHRVCECETLFSVANLYGTTPHLLARENGLRGEIAPGDMLVVTSREGRKYTVKEGDTLKSISVINGISAVGSVTRLGGYIKCFCRFNPAFILYFFKKIFCLHKNRR